MLGILTNPLVEFGLGLVISIVFVSLLRRGRAIDVKPTIEPEFVLTAPPKSSPPPSTAKPIPASRPQPTVKKAATVVPVTPAPAEPSAARPSPPPPPPPVTQSERAEASDVGPPEAPSPDAALTANFDRLREVVAQAQFNVEPAVPAPEPATTAAEPDTAPNVEPPTTAAAELAAPPSPADPFDKAFRDWVIETTTGQSGPRAPGPMLVAIERRLSRKGDATAVAKLQAGLDVIARLAPTCFEDAGAASRLQALAELAAPVPAVIWPRQGDAYDPETHAATGVGALIAKVRRPGLDWRVTGAGVFKAEVVLAAAVSDPPGNPTG